jgi:hypothetical protein
LRHILERLDERNAPRRELPHGSDNFRMTGMADEDNLAPATVMNLGLAMHFRDQRAGRVDREEIATLRLLGYRARHAMRRKDHRRMVTGNFAEFLDENRAFGAQAVDDIAVVHNLVTDVDRRPIDGERPLHRLDGSHHPRAEAARRAEQHFQNRLGRFLRHY